MSGQVVPHAYHFFGSIALLLRRDAESPDPTPSDWEMNLDEVLGHVEALGPGVGLSTPTGSMLPRPCLMSLLGGEPMLEPSAVETIVEAAARWSVAVEVWTTGQWVERYDDTRRVLSDAKRHIQGLRLHLSARILEKVGLERIEVLLRAAEEVRLPVWIRCAVGPGLPFPRELLAIEQINSQTSFIHAYVVAGTGTERDYTLPGPSRLRCAEQFALFVVPGGDVYPCTGGLGHERLRLGNLTESPISEIMTAVGTNAGLCALHRAGPRPLFDEIAASPVAGRLRQRYLDTCDFHRHVLADPVLRVAAGVA